MRGIKKEQEKKRTSNEDMPQVAKLKDKVDYQAGSVVSRKFIDKMHMFLCL